SRGGGRDRDAAGGRPGPRPRRSLGSGGVRRLPRLRRDAPRSPAAAQPRPTRAGRHGLRRLRRNDTGMTLTPVQRVDADVAIVGSGFSGALLALVLRQQGRSVALLERGTHPRFAIGESTTPLCNLRLEAIADRWDLP